MLEANENGGLSGEKFERIPMSLGLALLKIQLQNSSAMEAASDFVSVMVIVILMHLFL